MGSLMVSEIQDFTLGINNVRADHLLNPSESVLLANCDTSAGSLKAKNVPKKVDETEKPYFYQYMDLLYNYDRYRDNVLWDNTWYWTNGIIGGKVLPDGTERELGIQAPIKRPEVSVTSDGPLNGNYQYCYTYYDSYTGVESAPSPLSATLETSYSSVYVEGLEKPYESFVDKIRIYRIGGYLLGFTLVDTIDLTHGYIDKIGDLQVDGRLLETIHTNKPPFGIRNLTVMNGRFYASVGNKLYYSSIGNPDSWYIFNFFVLREDIIGIAVAQNGLMVFGDSSTTLLRGNDPSNFYLKSLSDVIGCSSPSSISYLNDDVIWLSSEGIMVSNGYSISNITINRLVNLRYIEPLGSIVKDNTYYLGFGHDLVPSFTLPPSEDLVPSKIVSGDSKFFISQGILVVDFKIGNGYSAQLIPVDDISCLDVLEDDIGYSQYRRDGVGYDLNVLSNPDTIDKSLLLYESPSLTDGSFSTLKEYDKVRIMFTGEVEIGIWLDNRRVNKKVLTSESKQFYTIGIPNSDNKGYSIKFTVMCRGELNAIQYSWKPRELP